jgi:ankyrin repeat protein
MREEIYSNVVDLCQSRPGEAINMIKTYGYTNLIKTVTDPTILSLRISHDVIMYGNLSILKLLPLDFINPGEHFSYIYNAITYHQNRIVKHLIKVFGPKFYNDNVEGMIATLASYGNLALIKELHKDKPDVNLNDALIQAVDYKCFRTVKYIVEYGANVNFVNEDGDCSFIKAIQSRDLRIIKYLVSRGVDIVNVDHGYILGSAVGPNIESTFDYLLELGFTMTTGLAEIAVTSNDIKTLKFLVSRGLNINDYSFDSVSLYLILPDTYEMLEYLLKHAKYEEESLSDILEHKLRDSFITIDIIQTLLDHGASLPNVVPFQSRDYNPELIKFILCNKPSLSLYLNSEQRKTFYDYLYI